ncbi:hypothetical protein F5J12DRAFT_808150, partial [Pisolithus orientalis]|uniref:uncharacterized protein n=1 Tax=Pisolithus orientalis TaxID=936130 RepID=UPI0022246C85
MSCPECGAECVVEDDGFKVCTSCGHYEEQTILATHVEHYNDPSSSRAVRNRKGWDLAGQSKEARDKRNMTSMSIFINSVLTRLNNPGLSPRAQAIFAQAMAAGGYRWGRKAKLTAGASVAIALRESHKSDSLRDIAFLLDESRLSIARAFQSVVSLLNFSLSSTDPSVHFPALQTHLVSLIRPDSGSAPPTSATRLPVDLLATLTPLSLPAAIRTATSLAGIISAYVPPLPITSLPTPPTACALLILAARNRYTELACALGSRFGLSGGVVSSRYKTIYDLIEVWIRDVPWLDQFPQKNKGRSRPKLPKRAVVAKGIKDVIQFREEIWKKQIDGQRKISLVIEPDPSENPAESASSSRSFVEYNVPENSTDVRSQATKRRKIIHGSTYEACRFLLNPLSFPTTSFRGSSSSREYPGNGTDAGDSNLDVSLATDLLTRPNEAEEFFTFQSKDPPTRLQLLALSRGGSAPQDISDEELFEQGELEGLFRSEEERDALIPLFELNWGTQSSAKDSTPVSRQNKPIRTEPNRGARRINMEVLSRILEGGSTELSLSDAGWEDNSEEDDNENKADQFANRLDFSVENICSSPISEPRRIGRSSIEEEVETIDDWRPLSPEAGFRRFGNTAEADRYEQEW